mgnify:CR=1 FL=1
MFKVVPSHHSNFFQDLYGRVPNGLAKRRKSASSEAVRVESPQKGAPSLLPLVFNHFVFKSSQLVNFKNDFIAGFDPEVVSDFRAIEFKKAARSDGTGANHVARVNVYPGADAFEDLTKGPRNILEVSLGELFAV